MRKSIINDAITSLWRQNHVATSLWRHNHVIIAPCARWGGFDSAPGMDIDDALRKVGGYRRWHLAVFVGISVSVVIPLATQNLNIVFIGKSATSQPLEKYNYKHPTIQLGVAGEFQVLQTIVLACSCMFLVGNRLLNNSWAVESDIMDCNLHFCFVFWHI